jgi:hypothetical protein
MIPRKDFSRTEKRKVNKAKMLIEVLLRTISTSSTDVSKMAYGDSLVEFDRSFSMIIEEIERNKREESERVRLAVHSNKSWISIFNDVFKYRIKLG